MKLDIVKSSLETSEVLKSSSFSIEDEGMIFDILRNKMYSDPIGSICREYFCNARDAHREVGKFDLPIQVSIPNTLSPVLKIQDWGPGISPERMEDIFIKYTASTKRNDNIQTGGFGLGSKLAFSYSDTFSVETVTNNIKRFYTAAIDESRTGKMFLLDEIPTEEENGTTIIIPIKPEDFNKFLTKTLEVVKYWKVLPVIKGIYPVPENKANDGLELFIAGKDWEVYIQKRKDFYQSGNIVDGVPLILIDGIPYKITGKDLGFMDINSYQPETDKRALLLRRHVRIEFPIGIISLSSSRESIHFDKKTQDIIKNKLQSIIDEMSNVILSKISSATNLYEAEILYQSSITEISQTLENKNMSWSGIKLLGISRIDHGSKSGAEITSYKMGRGRNGEMGLRRSKSNTLFFDKKMPIYELDLDRPSAPYNIIRELFRNNPQITTIQVIKFPNNTSKQYWIDNYHWDKLTTFKISSAPKPLREIRFMPQRVKREDFDCYVFLPSNKGFKRTKNIDYWSSTQIEKNNKDDIIYLIIEDVRGNYKMKTGPISINQIILYQKIIGKTIYGIYDKNIKFIGKNWINLNDAIRSAVKLKLKQKTPEQLLKEINSNEISYGNIFPYLKLNTTLIKNKKSIFLQYIEKSDQNISLIKENKELLEVVRQLGMIKEIKDESLDSGSEIYTLYSKVLNVYPLIYALHDTHRISNVSDKDIIKYINLIDEEEKYLTLRV